MDFYNFWNGRRYCCDVNTFEYMLYDGRTTYTLPFRVGDIVRVTDWGLSYSACPAFNIFFKGINEEPYYSQASEGHKYRNSDNEFKIMQIAHCNEYCNWPILYIMDRDYRDHIIGANGVSLVKQFPLRKNEEKKIVLKIIPIHLHR